MLEIVQAGFEVVFFAGEVEGAEVPTWLRAGASEAIAEGETGAVLSCLIDSETADALGVKPVSVAEIDVTGRVGREMATAGIDLINTSIDSAGRIIDVSPVGEVVYVVNEPVCGATFYRVAGLFRAAAKSVIAICGIDGSTGDRYKTVFGIVGVNVDGVAGHIAGAVVGVAVDAVGVKQ